MRAKVRVPTIRAMPRDRLEAVLGQVAGYRLGLVVAPAGSGKTTLLARLPSVLSAPVAWYRAERGDGDAPTLLAHLGAAIGAVVPELDIRPTRVEDLTHALEGWPGSRLVLVVDDLYTLEETPAEDTIERLIDYAPPSLTLVIGSRTQPSFNLSRLRVSGALREIGADDLRFRSWEVERLFRDFYSASVPPQELALLASRTEGWAAGLQLFHLATQGKSPDERRRILAGVTRGSRLTREYLARNVLAELPPHLRRFLLDTSVLGCLSGRLCDRLRGATGSARILEELERRSIFTVPLDVDAGSYRYHEALRSHLVALLVEEVGEVEVQERHRVAAGLLEADGALAEALASYCHAEDWASAERLLGQTGERLVDGPARWMDALPPALVRDDPWLILASARRHRAEGRLRAAIEAYARAERAFGPAEAAETSRRERNVLVTWLADVPLPTGEWAGILRAATVREPLAARRTLGTHTRSGGPARRGPERACPRRRR